MHAPRVHSARLRSAGRSLAHAAFAPASPAGSAVFSVAKVDPATGEIAGVFESIQPSDTDLGAKAPKDIKITGLWYGRLQQ